MENKPKQRTAAQRIEDLEHAMGQFYNSFNNLAAEVQTIKEAVKLLGNKVDSVVQALAQNLPVNDDTVSKLMIQNNVATLKAAVTKLVEDKVLVPADEVTPQGFIVAEEVNDEGIVVQPRTQFAIAALPSEIQVKVIGGKAGDVLEIQPGKLKLSIQEVYEIKTPEAKGA